MRKRERQQGRGRGKTAGKGAGEAVIPSALPGIDWLCSPVSSPETCEFERGPKMWLRGIQSRCQGRSVTSTPTKTPAIGRTSWHTTPCEPSNDKCLDLPLGTQFQMSPGVIFPKYEGNLISFSSPPRSPKSLMLIKAECLISSRWAVNLNYLFVFLFTLSVCLQFFVSSWKSVIRAHVSFWLESLPDEPSRWYVDDLLIYGF